MRSGQTSSRWCGAEVLSGGASSGVVLITSDHSSKFRGPSQNFPHVAPKRDVNITKLSCFVIENV
ncbi:hypothetical protein AVEN_94198-1, partial [Araneus ventricosus]